MSMIDCQMAVSSIGVMQRLERSVDGGTSSCCDDEEQSLRRPGRSETRTIAGSDSGARPCNTRNAMTATLK